MRKTLVAGNWKLNGSSEVNRSLIAGIAAGLAAESGGEVMVCPPYVYLAAVAAQLAGTDLLLGAQDVAAEAGGAFTGEVSAGMLAEVGCSHTLTGHSERRTRYGDTDEVVAGASGASGLASSAWYAA